MSLSLTFSLKFSPTFDTPTTTTQTSVSGSFEPSERVLDRAALYGNGEYRMDSSGSGGGSPAAMSEGWDGVADAQGSQVTR